MSTHDTQDHDSGFESPEVTDLGALEDMTEALAFRGPEDGGSKLVEAHHSGPVGP